MKIHRKRKRYSSHLTFATEYIFKLNNMMVISPYKLSDITTKTNVSDETFFVCFLIFYIILSKLQNFDKLFTLKRFSSYTCDTFYYL